MNATLVSAATANPLSLLNDLPYQLYPLNSSTANETFALASLNTTPSIVGTPNEIQFTSPSHHGVKGHHQEVATTFKSMMLSKTSDGYFSLNNITLKVNSLP